MYLWRGLDEWHGKQQNLAQNVKDLDDSADKLEAVFPSAFELLLEVIKASQSHSADVDRALKSAALDKDIDKRLRA